MSVVRGVDAWMGPHMR